MVRLKTDDIRIDGFIEDCELSVKSLFIKTKFGEFMFCHNGRLI